MSNLTSRRIFFYLKCLCSLFLESLFDGFFQICWLCQHRVLFFLKSFDSHFKLFWTAFLYPLSDGHSIKLSSQNCKLTYCFCCHSLTVSSYISWHVLQRAHLYQSLVLPETLQWCGLEEHHFKQCYICSSWWFYFLPPPPPRLDFLKSSQCPGYCISDHKFRWGSGLCLLRVRAEFFPCRFSTLRQSFPVVPLCQSVTFSLVQLRCHDFSRGGEGLGYNSFMCRPRV